MVISKNTCVSTHMLKEGEFLRVWKHASKPQWNPAVHTQSRLPDLTFPSPCTQRFHITLSSTAFALLLSLSFSLSFSHSLSKESAGLAVCLVWPPSNTNTELCELKAAVLYCYPAVFYYAGAFSTLWLPFNDPIHWSLAFTLKLTTSWILERAKLIWFVFCVMYCS